MTDDQRFAQLVSVACHDLRTPLATVFGFARTLAREDLGPPSNRYVEMIDAAAGQMGDLLDLLSDVVRIETGRYQPHLVEIDSLELARSAAELLGEERVQVDGEGGPVRVEPRTAARALAQLSRAAARHGGHDVVTLTVRGAEIELAPVGPTAVPVILGEDLRELGAPASAVVLRGLGAELDVEGERLRVRLSAA
ncbi:MAG TPA: histidine kinase dimerization/phospho-acceptor domain-containing protein [Gaiellaceae bacterium]|nr:histidine kinase dimerization/phospho-acceptor domain-containing protein [Gaiellaceae bacterium]